MAATSEIIAQGAGALAPTAPLVEVRLQNVSYVVQRPQVKATSDEIPSVFKTTARFLFGPVLAAQRLLQSGSLATKTQPFSVLDDVSGVFRPGTLTLVLSPAGGGKSALLKAIAGAIPKNNGEYTGVVTYSGSADGKKEGCHLPQLAQYVSQVDLHLPHLTVRQTLEFVHKNATVDPALHGYPHLAGQHEKQVDEIMTLLHLHGCQNTIIGNDLMRGVSGGEKKRVTVGEGLLTNAQVLALDHISDGLDSSVTYDIVKSLRQRAETRGMTVVMALLQPTPEVVSLFDDIVLLREGQVVFHGPVGSLTGYLRDLGFASAPPAPSAAVAEKEGKRDGTANTSSGADDDDGGDFAEYLVDLLGNPAAMYEPREEGGDDSKTAPPPTTTAALAAAWKSSAPFEAQMAAPPSAPPLELKDDWQRAQFAHAYSLSWWKHLALLIQRQFLLLRKNPLYLRARFMSVIIMSIILGGLYYQRTVAEALTYYGTFLNMQMNLAFGNLLEMAGAVEGKGIAKKQIAKGNYPASAYVLAGTLAHVPISVLTSLIFVSILYNMAGLYSAPSNFFFAWLIVWLVDLFFRNLMATFSYIGRTLQAAQAMPMPMLALFILFAGFMLPPASMGWLTFVFYIDPFSYGLRALALNEFLSPRYNFVPPGSAGASGQTLGVIYLQQFGFPTNSAWEYGAVIFLFGLLCIIVALAVIAFIRTDFDRNIGSRREPADAAALEAGAAKTSIAVAPPSAPVTAAGVVSASTPASPSAVVMPAALPSPTGPSLTSPRSPHSRHHGAHRDFAWNSTIPFTPSTVVFKDLCYTVALPKAAGGGTKTLLHNISGIAKPGRILALMGASGAGKSTLLDVLASRKNSGVMTGQVLVNGFPKEEGTFNRICGYVEQSNDLNNPLTTVREAIELSAKLRLPASTTNEQRHAFVAEILDLLELTELGDRMIGLPGGNGSLAPAERKRLGVGVELASNAPIMFADEPSTGLSSAAALQVLRVLKKVADTGRTVICTVHAPSAEIFSFFSDLLLLQRGGYVAYQGPLGPRPGVSMQYLVDYLQSVPGVQAYPEGMNVSSWMLDALAGVSSSSSNAKTDKKDGKSGGVALKSQAVAAAPAADVAEPIAPTPESAASAPASSPVDPPAPASAHVAVPVPSTAAGMGLEMSPAAVPAVPVSASSKAEANKAEASAAVGGGSTMIPGPLLQATFLTSPQGAAMAADIEKHSKPAEGATKLAFPSARARSLPVQMAVLTERQWRGYQRNIGLNFGRFVAMTFMQLLFGIVWFNAADNQSTVAGVQTLIAAIFMTASMGAMIQLNTNLPGALQARPAFYRETSSRLYHPIAHSFSMVVVEAPWMAGLLICSLPISYFMLGLSANASVFFFHYFATLILCYVYWALGTAMAAALPTFEVAQALGGLLLPLFFLFGGLFSPPSQMVAGAAWFSTIDPITYAFKALIPIHFWCQGAQCPQVTIITPTGNSTMPTYTFVSQKYEVYYPDRWEDVGYLSIFILVFVALGALATRYIRHIVR